MFSDHFFSFVFSFGFFTHLIHTRYTHKHYAWALFQAHACESVLQIQIGNRKMLIGLSSISVPCCFFLPHTPLFLKPLNGHLIEKNKNKNKNAASRLHRCRRPSIINVDEPLQASEPVHVYGTGCRYYGAESPSQRARGQKHRPPPFQFFVFVFVYREITLGA